MTSDEQREWIKTLKVGDTVALVAWNHERQTRYAVVSRFTPTQVVVQRTADNVEMHFHKHNGHHAIRRDLAMEELCSVEGAHFIRLHTRLQNARWWKMPVSVLEQVNSILDGIPAQTE